MTEVHRWARRLIGLAVTPVQYLRVVWNNCLANAPMTGDALVDTNIHAFWDYYVHQWLPNREQVGLWNHYDRDDPCTTNNAEGYHNDLSSLFDTRRRLPLGIFLSKIQELHNEIHQSEAAGARCCAGYP